MDSEALACRLAELADSKGATEIVALDMRELVSYTDFLAICTARNERQARAIVEEVRLRVKKESALLPGGVDGAGDTGWIVLDYLDGQPVGLSGVQVAPVSVAAVASVYGVQALVGHPALAWLRTRTERPNVQS